MPGGGKRLWRIWRNERPIKGRRKRSVFCMSIRGTVPEVRDQVASMNRVWSADGLFGRDLHAHHVAIPARADR